MFSKNAGFVQNKYYYNYQLNKCVCGGILGPYITHLIMEFLWKNMSSFKILSCSQWRNSRMCQWKAEVLFERWK